MLKLKLLLRRVRAFDFRHISVYIHEVKKETRLPTLFIFFDMLLCILLYNVGFYDYHIFGFVHIRSHKQRKTFFTMNDNWRLFRLANHADDRKYFEDKILFCDTFKSFLGREYLDLRKETPASLAAFLKKHPIVFAKAPAGFGGLEVKRYDSTTTDLDDAAAVQALYDDFCQSGLVLMEEAVVQHDQMNALYPASLNTIRVCTLTDASGEPHVLYSYIRTGRNGSFVDNTTSGGLSTLICSDGVIRKPALSDKTGEYFDEHPDTNCSFISFAVPFYPDAIALCKKAAKVLPRMRYIGWDVGITPTGPILIEGNDLPAYDGQIYHQQEHPGTGLKPLIRSIIPEL